MNDILTDDERGADMIVVGDKKAVAWIFPEDFEGAEGEPINLAVDGLPIVRISGIFDCAPNYLDWGTPEKRWKFHFCDNEKAEAAYSKMKQLLRESKL